jgi:hypothetical protein
VVSAARRPAVRIGEVVAAAGGGALLGAGIGRTIGLGWPLGAVAALNGAVGAAADIYDWRSPPGWVAFTLDSTWALPTTAAGLVLHAVSHLGRDPGWVASLSTRANRHVYARGFVLRRGFAFCLGNIITGACAGGDIDDGSASSRRRRLLVERHEDRHVWQARWFGPLYPVLYGGWMLFGSLAGVVIWATRRPAPLGRCVETLAYYDNPFEYLAYQNDRNWPPRGAVASLAWRARARHGGSRDATDTRVGTSSERDG